MLGESIEDPHGVESGAPVVAGLGLLALRTRFEATKLTARITARVDAASFLTDGTVPQKELAGYEIHMGRIEPSRIAAAPFRVASRNGARVAARDGAISADGAVVGTMLHGILEDDHLRGLLIRALMKRKGLKGRESAGFPAAREAEYERLARTVSDSLDLAMLDRIIGLA